jgi:hypothetical protein
MTSKRTQFFPASSYCLPALVGAALAIAVSSTAVDARAQQPAISASDLKAARELFQEAYKDEQEKRYAQALEKFQRVAAVKESALVRYRIASVMEGLGRFKEARDAFRALAAAKPTLPAAEQEIAGSAAERAHALDRRIPKLVVRLQENPPPDTRVTVDGAPVPASAQPGKPIELDPGEHTVQATAPGSKQYESKVTLTEGVESAVVVGLVPLEVEKPPPPKTPETPTKNNTLAYVALGAGGVLLVTGVALLLVREGKISDLEKACPNGNCPASKKNDLESTRDSAELFGPLGVTLGVIGLAAAGTGIYLLVRTPKTQDPANGTTTPAPNAGLRLGPKPVPGGAMLGLSTTF